MVWNFESPSTVPQPHVTNLQTILKPPKKSDHPTRWIRQLRTHQVLKVFRILQLEPARRTATKFLPISSTYNNVSHTLSPCLTPVCFKPVCSNAPCQVTTLLHLRSLIFGLKPFGWLRSFKLTHYLWWEYHFWFTPTLSGTQLGRKTMAACTYF